MTLAARSATTSLLHTLEAEIVAVQRFVTLLELEQRSLGAGSTGDLPVYANEKAKLVADLNNLAAQRNAFLTAAGFGADLAGITSWLSKHPEEENAADAWSKILTLAAEARELNRLNGELIRTRMQYNALALEALQGSKNQLDLYGPDGQSKAARQRRINDAV